MFNVKSKYYNCYSQIPCGWFRFYGHAQPRQHHVGVVLQLAARCNKADTHDA